MLTNFIPCPPDPRTRLRSHQNKNGGWGESYLCCVDKHWTETGSQSLQEHTPSLGDGESGVRDWRECHGNALGPQACRHGKVCTMDYFCFLLPRGFYGDIAGNKDVLGPAYWFCFLDWFRDQVIL